MADQAVRHPPADRRPHRRPPRALTRALLLVAALSLLTGACRGGDDEPATTTTTATTSTTAVDRSGLAPLRGEAADPATLDRPALVVKVDNAPRGRPQAGLNEADIVVVEAVEGGITRLAVIYHSRVPDEVGPVRSARSTDIVIASALNHPLFAYSGANAAFQAMVNEAPLVDVGHSARSGSYFRVRGRPAPYNLWGRAPELLAAAPEGAERPPAWFEYRGSDQEVDGDAFSTVKIEYVGRVRTDVTWSWDAASSSFRRTQNGTAHVDAGGTPVQPANVVVQLTNYRDTGYRDQSGEPVPEGVLVGEGEAWVLTAGKVITGRWEKSSPEAPTRYLDASGAPILLTPGSTWIELAKPGAAALT